MHLHLNPEHIVLHMEDGKLCLSILPEQITGGLELGDREALRRYAVAEDPAMALEHALSILRESNEASDLRVCLGAVEALRRDLRDFVKDADGKVWEGGKDRSLTPEELARIAEAVGPVDPASGSDAEHPPEGWYLAVIGEARNGRDYLYFDGIIWRTPFFTSRLLPLETVDQACAPIAFPISPSSPAESSNPEAVR